MGWVSVVKPIDLPRMAYFDACFQGNHRLGSSQCRRTFFRGSQVPAATGTGRTASRMPGESQGPLRADGVQDQAQLCDEGWQVINRSGVQDLQID